MNNEVVTRIVENTQWMTAIPYFLGALTLALAVYVVRGVLKDRSEQ